MEKLRMILTHIYLYFWDEAQTQIKSHIFIIRLKLNAMDTHVMHFEETECHFIFSFSQLLNLTKKVYLIKDLGCTDPPVALKLRGYEDWTR